MKKLAIFFVLTLSACGPIYDTNYQFTPPNTEGGRACIYQCENSRNLCRQVEELRVQRCEDESYWQQQRCEDDLNRRKGRSSKWYECGGISCTADYDQCDQQHRSCYQSCGGRVEAETRCVANCEKIPPPPPPAPPPPTKSKAKRKA